MDPEPYVEGEDVCVFQEFIIENTGRGLVCTRGELLSKMSECEE